MNYANELMAIKEADELHNKYNKHYAVIKERITGDYSICGVVHALLNKEDLDIRYTTNNIVDREVNYECIQDS